MEETKEESVLDNSPLKKEELDFVLVLDFEATCDDGGFKNPEIIEFPCVVLSMSNLKVVTEFHQYVKPTLNPTLTKFCTELTGITQETVDKGLILSETLKTFDAWLISQGLIDKETRKKRSKWTFVTCGDWDLEKMLPSQTRREKIERQYYFRSFCNVKKIFQKFYKQTHLLGMAGMLNVLKMELQGHHHSGIDDCRNIARIVVRMVEDGCPFAVTTELPDPKEKAKEAEKPAKPAENPELVTKSIELGKSIVETPAIQELIKKAAVADKKSLMRLQGGIVKETIDKLKLELSEFSNLSTSDRKEITSSISKHIESLVQQ